MTDDTEMRVRTFIRKRALHNWRLQVGVAVAVVVGLVAGSWSLASAFTSPQQLQAAASPPPATPVLAEVERGQIEDSRVISGTVERSAHFESALTPFPEAPRSVVTDVLLAAGDEVAAGSAILAVNDSPVFAIESPFAFYRDLGPGDNGADVRSLQSTLVEAGLLDEADGVFGARTLSAVTKLFTRAGLPVPGRAAPTGESEAGSSSAPVASPYVPLSAVLAIPSLPAVLTSAPTIGTLVDADATVVVSDSGIVVRAAAPEGTSTADLIGLHASGVLGDSGPFDGIVEPDTRIVVDRGDDSEDPAALASGADSKGDDVESILVSPADGSVLTADQIGHAVTLIIKMPAIIEDALLVPSSAVADEQSGHGAVLVEQADGSFLRVRVSILASSRGVIAVSPAEANLAEGDRVKVG